MNEENRDLKVAGAPGAGPATATQDPTRGRRLQLGVNWIRALLTIPAAIAACVFAFVAVMSTAACSDKQCPNLGPGGVGFGVLFYGAPVVAVLTIIVSFFTAQRRWGIVVPLFALALLVAEITILATTVAQ
jgi:hypothetical protein